MTLSKLDSEILSFWRALNVTLDSLADLTAAMDDDGLNWVPPVEGANSLTVLATHTLGNAEENIIEILGGLPVRRERDVEFAAKEETSRALTARWEVLRPRLESTLACIDRAALNRVYHHPRRDGLTGRDILLQAVRHAAQHLGQAEVTRDLYRASHATR